MPSAWCCTACSPARTRSRARRARRAPQSLAWLEREPETITRAAERIDPDKAQARGSTPRALAAALRGDLAAIVHRCLEKTPARRYPSAEALASDLRAWLDGRPVGARRGGRGYALRKLVARHRWGVAASIGALLAIGAALALALWQADRAQGQAARAEAHAAQARANAARAQASAARAVSTKDFLVDLFTQASPLENAQGKQLTAVDLLKTAAQRIDSELEDAPESQAELRAAIGASLFDLGERDSGMALMDRGIAQLRSLRIAGPGLAVALNARATARSGGLGDVDGAERDAREAIALLAQTGDGQRLLRIQVRSNLATNAALRGNYHEGLALAQAIHRDRTALLGRDHPDTVVDWNNMAASYLHLDRYAESEAAFQHAADLLSAQHGPDHPRMVWLQIGLATARAGQAARIDQAEAAYAQGERVLHKVLGADHPAAVTLHAGRGALLLRQGRYAQAETAYARALALARAVKHPQELHYQASLGLTLLLQARVAEAEALLTPAVAGLARMRVAHEPTLNRLQAARGLAWFRLGRGAEGEREIRAALDRLQAAELAATDEYAEVAGDLAAVLEASNRPSEAQAWRRRAHAAFVRVYGATHPRTRRAAEHLQDHSH